MRALELRFVSLPIPFRVRFGHASAVREQAENIIVAVRDAQGRVGLGEGCPRSYVTGETLASATGFIEKHRADFLGLTSLDDLQHWMADRVRDIDVNPSAFCAVELALLDLFARQAEQPVESFLGVPSSCDATASAVYGTGKAWKFYAQAVLFRLNGMRDSKLKVSGDARKDLQRAAFLARAGKVRLDANNLWKDVDIAAGALKALSPHAWAVEEPLAARDWRGLRDLNARTGLAIIADESLVTFDDLGAIPAGEVFIPNFRVSKLGGLIRSADLLRRALAERRKIIVGAQVGETSILARAGLALVAGAGANLVGYEGGYGPVLLAYDVATPKVKIGRHGIVGTNDNPRRPGLGLSPEPLLTAALGL